MFRGATLVVLPLCFPAQQVPSEKRSALKEIICSQGSKFFPFGEDPFSKERQK